MERKVESYMIGVQDEHDYQDKIHGAGSRLVVVEFTAPGCMPCRSLKPLLDQMSVQLQGRAIFLQVDVDRIPALAVERLPTVQLYRNGSLLQEIVGANQALIRSSVMREVGY